MIALVFRYEVREPDEFVRMYGPEGDWAQFFRQGRGYIGTELLRDVDELRSPVQVVDLARALLELVELDHAVPIHLGGSDDVSRFDFAVLLGADPERLEKARTTVDRAADVTLDSSLASSLLATRLRGVYEVLSLQTFSNVPKRSSWT